MVQFREDVDRKEAEIRQLRDQLQAQSNALQESRKERDKLAKEKASLAADNAKEIVVALHRLPLLVVQLNWFHVSV